MELQVKRRTVESFPQNKIIITIKHRMSRYQWDWAPVQLNTDDNFNPSISCPPIQTIKQRIENI